MTSEIKIIYQIVFPEIWYLRIIVVVFIQAPAQNGTGLHCPVSEIISFNDYVIRDACGLAKPNGYGSTGVRSHLPTRNPLATGTS